MPTIRHVHTNAIADVTGTVTVWNGVTTETRAATDLVRPSDWNSSHAGGWDLAASNVTYTSGTVILSGGANITVGTNAGQTITISGNPAQTVQTQNMVAISASNALFSSGTVVMSGFGDVTVNTAAGTIRISAPVQTAETAISGLANSETTYTSGTVTFEGTNNITVFSTTGQRFRISGANTHAQQTAISAISNSNTTYTSGTVGLSELGAITIRSTTGNQFQFSVAAQTAQTGISALYDGANSISSGTVRLTNANNITFTINGQTLSGSVHAQQTGISALSNSNTTYTSGTVGLSELGAITIRSTTGNQFQFSVNSQTVQTQGITLDELSIGVSTGGATAGNTTVQTGQRFVLVGTDNISLSQGTGAGSTTVSIRNVWSSATTVSSVSNANAVGANNSRFAMEAHIHEGVRRMGLSNIGNTSGTSGVFAGSNIVLAGGNNITISQSTDAASNITMTISAPNLGAGAMSAGVSNLGNTAGATGVTGTRLVLVGTNGVTLSQTTDANGGTVSISAGGAAGFTHGGFNPYLLGEQMTQTHGQASWTIQPMDRPLLPFAFDRFGIKMFHSNATNSSGSNTVSLWVGIYTRNVSTLSLYQSTSSTYGITESGTVGIFSSIGGPRWLTMGFTSTLTENDYWLGYAMRTTSGAANASYSIFVHSQQASTHSGVFSVASNASGQEYLGLGVFSVSSTAVPGSIAFSAMTNGASTMYRRSPVYMFGSGTA